MTLQDNSPARQEAAREAYNDYIQYLYIYGELDNDNDCSADSQKSLSIKSER